MLSWGDLTFLAFCLLDITNPRKLPPLNSNDLLLSTVSSQPGLNSLYVSSDIRLIELSIKGTQHFVKWWIDYILLKNVSNHFPKIKKLSPATDWLVKC